MSVYSAIDKIVCINLETRKDKRKTVSKVFDALKIPVEFYTAKQELVKGGRYGCFHSHVSVIKQAYEENAQTLLVFEDDVVPSPSYTKASVQRALSFVVDNSHHVDIIQLGYFPVVTETGTLTPYIQAPFLDKNREFMKITTTGFHAYCLSRRGMHNILASDWESQIEDAHFDIFVASLPLNGYCFVPSLFEQYSCLGSDNVARTLLESSGRIFQCTADKVYLMHKISIIKKYGMLFSTLLAMYIFIIILFVVTAFTTGK
jgi:hypothetical protein